MKGFPAAPLDERFWSKVTRITDSCWDWKGTIEKQGYGVLYITTIFEKGKKRKLIFVKAHRFAYELLKGPIPEGLTIDHLCRNRACVNPDHLEPVTNRENILRGETIARRNAEKTHCPKGHPYSLENLDPSTLKEGRRRCLICKREQARLAA